MQTAKPNYSERIRRIKIKTCHCGNKIRGKQDECSRCRDKTDESMSQSTQ